MEHKYITKSSVEYLYSPRKKHLPHLSHIKFNVDLELHVTELKGSNNFMIIILCIMVYLNPKLEDISFSCQILNHI